MAARPGYGAMRLAIAVMAMAACMASAAADRVALLIGNNAYGSAPLRNAVNDARDLGEALKELGFQVIVRENASRKDMIEGIREFGAAIDGASTALFFYAGHAMQFKERNYLVPIDAAMGSEEDVTFFSVEIGQIFDRMDRARTRFNFIILDACRDNPFASSFKLTSAGLAQMSSPSGTLIAYATSPGSVAADGFGRNGIYTKHILQNIKVPDLPAEIMFKRVREGVERETRKLQTPWDSSSLKGDFAFNASGRSGAAAAPAAGPSADVTLQIEREFWISVRDSNRAEDIQAYIEKYPNGNFTALAKNRLDSMLRPARVATTEPSPPPKPAVEPSSAPSIRAPATPPAAAAKIEEHAADKPLVVAAAPASAPPGSPPAAALPAPAIAPPAAVAKPPEQLPGREIAPGVRELTFPDGSVYRGAVRGSSLHGKGEYVSKAFRYEGDFNDGLKQGQGTYIWDNGDRYDGRFANDRPDGIGKYHFANGDSYEGEVKGGVIAGRGTYLSKNGDVFEGSFAGGKPDGVGVYRFASGDRYEGEMAQGKLQGKGRYYSKSGDRIEAPFVDGKPQGIGTYHFSNGDRYEGEITGGALSGQGVYFYGSGLKYEGEVRQGQPQGKGVFWFLDGTRFEGTFENGLARARGEIVKQDGSRSAAEIVDGNAKLLN
ncbi:MAG: caspase family protein [Usitatibacter sp.]